MGINRFVVTVVAGVAVWGASMVSLQARQGHIHTMVQNQVLVDVVRSAVQQFSEPSAAEDADYHPFAGCVSGPQSGAMGVHYVNGGLVGDGVVDEQHPEALVYEPKGDHLELVAVEFIVIASQWDAAHKIWFTDGVDIPGLFCETASFDELVEIVLDLAPDLLHTNAGVPVGQHINITIIAERHATCIAA